MTEHIDADPQVLRALGAPESESTRPELMELNLRLRLLLSSVAQAVWETDSTGRVVVDSPSWRAYTGQTLEQMLGEGWINAVHPEDRGGALRRWKDALRRCGLVDSEFRVRHGDGWRWTNVRAAPMLDAKGRVLKWVGMNIDIHERKLNEQALRESEAQCHALAANLPGGAVFVVDQELRYLAAEGDALHDAGYRSPSFVGRPMQEVLSDELFASYEPRYRQVLAGGRFEWEHEAHGRVYLSRGTPLRDAEGRVYAALTCSIDITARKRAEEAVQQLSERLLKAMDVDTVGVLFFDLSGRIHDANLAFTRMSGYTREELRSMGDWATLTAPEDLPLTRQTAEALAAQGRAAPYEKQMLRKSGERWWGLFAPSRLSGEGENALCVEFILDITRTKQVEAALQETHRRKDEFLATLGHELRNPLAPIRNGLQIARLSLQSDPVLLGVVEMMDRQLSHLVRLVDDLLDVGRISAGKIVLERAPVRLTEVIGSSIEGTRAAVDQHGHRLSVELSPQEVLVNGDFERLVQVLTNLLSNAAKYTPAGGRIDIRLSATRDEAQLDVIDTGIGIPQPDLAHVFDLFSQVRAHQNLAEGGLGIGLAIVRTLVDMHGGSVSVTSAGLGQGSTFTVRLPRLPPAAEKGEAEAGSESALAAAPLKVVVADDNADAAESLAALLKLHGHQVVVVHDGAAAVEAVRRIGPDLAILDLGMPRMNGWEAARRIRGTPETKHTRCVALTGWGQEGDRQRTFEAGFDWHLVKPMNIQQLSQVLNACAGSARSQGC